MPENKFHILVIDDEQQILDSLSEHLEYLNYKCSPFTSVRKALDVILSTNTIDLIISDIRMPEMSGIDLVKNLRDFVE